MDDKICIKRLKRKNKSREEVFKENFEAWVGYWRNNIHRFITDYLGLILYDFQKCLIWMFEQSAYDIFIASRGLKLSIYFQHFILKETKICLSIYLMKFF